MKYKEDTKFPRSMEHKDKPRCGKTSKESQNFCTAHPSVKITKCISFQKFRYDKRTGKKYQDKDFMELRLSNLSGREVRIIIMCIDATKDSNIYKLHPNGLIGKDCHHGIYDKKYIINEVDEEIRIPYIRIDRFKTRGSQYDNLQRVLEKRAQNLPLQYKERCLSHCKNEGILAHMINTTDVRFGVIVSDLGPGLKLPTHAISHVVGDANEKTALGILKLSQDPIPASGSLIDIFTTEEGPKVEEGKFSVYITCDHDTYGHWESDKMTVSAEDLLYGRVIRYQVPPLTICQNTPSPINAVLKLECPDRNQYCSCSFVYSPCDEAVIPKEQERKRTFPDQYIETDPKRMKMNSFAQNEKQGKTSKINPQKTVRSKKGNLKKRNIPLKLDLGVKSCNDMNFFPRESTARESCINVEVNRGQTEVGNFIVSNPGTSSREGIQENNSPIWDHHHVNGVCASCHSGKVSPAANDTMSKGVNAITRSTEMQDGQNAMAQQDAFGINNLKQFFKEPRIESPKLIKATQEINPSTSTNGPYSTHNLRPVSSICQGANPCRAPKFPDIKFYNTISCTWKSTSPWEVTPCEENLTDLFPAISSPQRKENSYLNNGPIRNTCMQHTVTNESSVKRSPENITEAVRLESFSPTVKADISSSQNEEKSEQSLQLTTEDVLDAVIDLENRPPELSHSESFPSGG